MNDRPLIALISAVPAAIAPTRQAFVTGFPDAELWNLIDDRLLEEADRRGGLVPPLRRRMERLIDHALTEGAHGILVTCSLYSPVAHEHARASGVPILAPDDGVFAAARDEGYTRVVLASSGAGPLEDSTQRLRDFLGHGVEVAGALASDAAPAARSGDIEAMTDALESAVRATSSDAEAVVLGQFSLSPAADALAERLGRPVLAGPRYAVSRLQGLLGSAGS